MKDEQPPVASSSPTPEHLAASFDLLSRLLEQNEGVVSSIEFKREIVSRLEYPDELASECMREMKFLDAETANRIGKPGVKTYHHGRGFLSKKMHEEALAKTDQEAAAKEQAAEETPDQVEEPEKESVQNRQEEARLGAYVKAVLENIYSSEHVPDEAEFLFDVHQERAGAIYENVDLIAVHWRSEATVDLVTVEVKLQFSAKAVHQACNYSRFSHRVWVAAVVTADVTEAGLELRSQDPGLFDYAISRGIGILACRRSPGRSYQVFPIHWPIWHSPEPVERELFIERYRSLFEEARVVEPQKKRAARF